MSLETVPLTEMSDSDIARIGHSVHHVVRDPLTKRELKSRNLRGVLRRHGIGPLVSVDFLHSSRDRMQEDADFGAFALLYDGVINAFAGMSTYDKTLPVRKLVGALPAKIERRMPLMHSGENVWGANVAAWMSKPYGSFYEGELISAYAAVHEAAKGPVWTLNPHDHELAARALSYAGYETDTVVAHYDDGESGWAQVPLSQMFTSGH